MISKKIVLSLLLLVALFLAACGNSKQLVVAPKKSLPIWYKMPSKTTDTTLYATGQGQDKKEAITNALTMMASTLSVSVASKFSSKTVENQGIKDNYQITNVSEVNSDVKKTRISHYELVNADSLGFKKYIVQIKSDKKKLFDSMHNELQQKFYVVEKRQSTLENYNALKQLQMYETSRTMLKETPNELIVLNVLNNDFDASEYVNALEKLESDYNTLESKITFSISSNADASNLKMPIQSGLSSKKLAVKKSSGKYHFRVRINSKIEKASSYGFTLARSAISITTKDYRGNIIASNKLNITGQSTQGFAIAKENVAVKLNAMIEKEKISKVMGINILFN